MNIIDLISHELSLISSDMSTWKLKFHSNVHKNSSSIEAHNTTLYRGRAVRFYIKYGINKENCDITREKVVFMQPDIKHMETRDRLSGEIEDKLNNPVSSAKSGIEKAAIAILKAIKEID